MKEPHIAEIVSVGTELLLGNVVNTDARDISVLLSEIGINVYYHTVVGDNPARLTEALRIARRRADIIITTGGLGPTYDDLTKRVVCEAFGRRLVFHPEQAERIRSYFAQLGRLCSMTPNNEQQAYLPEDCEVFINGWGTAPGCAFETDGVRVLLFPGPPRECTPMFRECAIPYLKKLSSEGIWSHVIHIFGLGESDVEYQLRDRMESLTNPTLAPYVKTGEVTLRATAKAGSAVEAEALLAPVIAEVRERFGGLVYGVDVDSLEDLVVQSLKSRGMTISVAESCTGGLIAKRITDIPGASAVFPGGVVSYSNEVKTAELGVDAELLRTRGAVNPETARRMAEGVRSRLHTDLGVATTGIAGPDSDEFGTPVGTVFVALAAPDGTWCRSLKLSRDRDWIRTIAAHHALDMARRWLIGLPVEELSK